MQKVLKATANVRAEYEKQAAAKARALKLVDKTTALNRPLRYYLLSGKESVSTRLPVSLLSALLSPVVLPVPPRGMWKLQEQALTTMLMS